MCTVTVRPPSVMPPLVVVGTSVARSGATVLGSLGGNVKSGRSMAYMGW